VARFGQMLGACYRIVVKDELGASYGCAFEGMRLEPSEGETAIVGPIADQAQLQGILGRIGSLNLVLLSVNVVDSPALSDATA
jgi:hypothetical protein